MSLRFSDPVHGEVEIPERYRDVLESPVLARLRNVRQLGFTLATYPGAVHTRFEHTLGTCRVLTDLFSVFGIAEEDDRQRLIQVALTSEIGIYPFSYSTRAIFNEAGISKSAMAEQLRSTYLSWIPTAIEADKWPESTSEIWSRIKEVTPEYGYFTPVKLASTVDYVLRDAHYTGRNHGCFDYRYFASCEPRHNVCGLLDCLASLHRAIDSLNATYGDLRRRALSVAIKRLCGHLAEYQSVDISHYSSAGNYLTLDDDRFLDIVLSAINKTDSTKRVFLECLFNVSIQRSPLKLVELQRTMVQGDLNREDDIADAFASYYEVTSQQVLLIGQPFDQDVGFRLFGHDYINYSEASGSALFCRLTKLTSGLEELKPDTEKYYALIV